MYQAEKDGMRLTIENDIDCDGPRQWDNLGTMVCFHSKYTLGDKNDHGENPWRWLFSELTEEEMIQAAVICNDNLKEPDAGKIENLEQAEWVLDDRPKGLEAMIEVFERRAVILPLYLYDHSGITMSTSSFSCRWDSGQVGWIYITAEKIIEEYGQDTPEQREEVKGYLQGEVETYDQYLTGDIWGFTLERMDTCDQGEEHAHHEDSCWGFYGTDWKENGIMEHIGQEHAELVELLEWT